MWTQCKMDAFDFLHNPIFSCKDNSRITNVRLSVCQSVHHKNPSASQNCAFQPNLNLSQPLCQSAIMPLSHHAPPLRIITIGHHACQPSCPYGLLTYALLLRLLSHFGLFYYFYFSETSWYWDCEDLGAPWAHDHMSHIHFCFSVSTQFHHHLHHHLQHHLHNHHHNHIITTR